MQQLARVAESRSAFTEVKTIAALSVPLQASGELFYRRPDYFEKTTMRPQRETLVVDGDRLTLTAAGEPSRVVDLGSQAMIRGLVDAIRGTLAGDLALLSRVYRVEMAGELAGWRLTLTPTDPAVARVMARIVITGREASLQSVEAVQANGDESQMTISPNS